MEKYLELSAWLADINNEREEKNETYVYHLSSLEKFVMIKFTEEKTVVPPDSSVLPFVICGVDWVFSGLESIILPVENILH